MPICSYVVQPDEGAATRLKQSLNALDGCEATQATSHNILVLVTETQSSEEENRLRATLKDLPDIACLNLAFGDVTLIEQKEMA